MEISPQSLAVLAAVIDYMERHKGRSPALKDIAVTLDRKIPTIRHHMQRLEAAGYIKKRGGVRPFEVVRDQNERPYREVARPRHDSYIPEGVQTAADAYRDAARIADEMKAPCVAAAILARLKPPPA